MSHHIQADISRVLTFLDDTDSEKGACGRYKKETERETIDLSLRMTIFNRKKAPAAAVITNTRE